MHRSSITDCVLLIKVELSRAVQDQILSEFKQLTDICDVLKSLQIAIGFLSSAGGLQSMLLSEYLHTGLKLSRKDGLKSAKVRNIFSQTFLYFATAYLEGYF